MVVVVVVLVVVVVVVALMVVKVVVVSRSTGTGLRACQNIFAPILTAILFTNAI